jgi:hypothetical protein
VGVARHSYPPAWTSWTGPGGWNDLDSLDVGNGVIEGINPDERRAYMTLWAISAAPLYTGDDLTQLDAYGLKLLTNQGHHDRPARCPRPAGHPVADVETTS